MKHKFLILIFTFLFLAPIGLDSYNSFAKVQKSESALWPRHGHRYWGIRIRRPRQMVYVCNSGNSYLFHKRPDCPNLSGCSDDVVRVSRRNAKVMGMKRCPVCF